MARNAKGDFARLLPGDQKESSFHQNSAKSKKKGLFTKVFSKKKQLQPEYEPPTAPNTPEVVIDVTVVASEFDPSKPYGINTTISELSDAHVRANTPTAAARKVGFQEQEETETELAPTDQTNHPSLTAFPSQEDKVALFSSSVNGDTKTSMTQTVPEKDCSESIMTQTLGFFDDICQVPHPPPAGAADASSTANPPQWGTVPSEDDDTTYRDSLQSTIETIDESTLDRTFSIQTGTTKSAPTVKPVEQPKAMVPKSPSQDHENFEVVLDSSILQGPLKRRGWFYKKEGDEEREEEEEKKMEDKDKDDVDIVEAIQFEPEARSPSRKSLVKRLFSVIKKKDGEEEDDLQPLSPSLRGTDFLESSDVLSGMEEPIEHTAIEHTAEEHNKKQANEGETNAWDNLLDQLEPAEIIEVDDSWNNMLTQLETVDLEKQKQEKPKKLEKKGETKSKDKKQKKHARNLSWSMMAKTLTKPIAAVRKRAKDDSNVKYQSKPPLPTAPKQRKPKPLWKAVVDPNSGKTYYYHRKTRKTSWTKPKELKDFEELSVDATPVRKNPQANADAQSPSRAELKTTGVDSPNGEETTNAMFSTPARKLNPNESISASSVSESPIKPPMVVEAALTAESQQQISKAEQGMLDQSFDQNLQARARSSNFDDTWEKKREIERLLTGLSPPDKSSVDKLMSEYEGKEDLLLRQLRDKVESQPFDEPFLDEPADNTSSASPRSPMSAPKFHSRTTTYMSKASATTKSSTITDKTERIKNTLNNKSLIGTISENQSTATSISSHHEEDRLEPVTKPSISGYTANPRIPSRVPVPRERDLMVEELTNSRVAAETFDSNGRIVRGRASDYAEAEEGSYYGDNEEVDTYGTDSVSALSDHDTDFMHRKENFDAARRRALDDAIEREDWDLAASLSEGMGTSDKSGDYAKAHVSWNQSELDKFIANNDWDAVKSYIARMRDRKNGVKTSDEDGAVIPSPSRTKTTGTGKRSVVKAPSRAEAAAAQVDLTQDTALKKRIGSKSQLQHRELMSDSSWTSDSSYDDSYDSDYS